MPDDNGTPSAYVYVYVYMYKYMHMYSAYIRDKLSRDAQCIDYFSIEPGSESLNMKFRLKYQHFHN